MEYFLLVIGFVLLVKGADFFVDGAVNIAQAFKIPTLIIGLTIVAFGTSAPEAAVSISAALKGSAGLSIGNILGSNIFNIAFILGLTAMIYPLKVQTSTIKKEIPLALVGGVLLFVFADDMLFGANAGWIIERNEGIALLVMFVVFLYYIIESAAGNKDLVFPEDAFSVKQMSVKKAVFIGCVGLSGVVAGGYIVVWAGSTIALRLGMSETLVGLTIVAVGTSLPELVTSLVAARKKEADIAVGNIVGSNIFNVLFILGFSSILSPLPVDPILFFDLLLNIGITILLFFFCWTGFRVNRGEGALLLLIYVLYLVYLIAINLS